MHIIAQQLPAAQARTRLAHFYQQWDGGSGLYDPYRRQPNAPGPQTSAPLILALIVGIVVVILTLSYTETITGRRSDALDRIDDCCSALAGSRHDGPRHANSFGEARR